MLVRKDPFLLPEGQAAVISGTQESTASSRDPSRAVLGFPGCSSVTGSDPHGLGDTTCLQYLILMLPVASLLPCPLAQVSFCGSSWGEGWERRADASRREGYFLPSSLQGLLLSSTAFPHASQAVARQRTLLPEFNFIKDVNSDPALHIHEPVVSFLCHGQAG